MSRHYFTAYFYLEFGKCGPVPLASLDIHVLKTRIRAGLANILFCRLNRPFNGTVQSFGSNENAPLESKALAKLALAFGKHFGVFHRNILVIQENLMH